MQSQKTQNTFVYKLDMGKECLNLKKNVIVVTCILKKFFAEENFSKFPSRKIMVCPYFHFVLTKSEASFGRNIGNNNMDRGKQNGPEQAYGLVSSSCLPPEFWSVWPFLYVWTHGLFRSSRSV